MIYKLLKANYANKIVSHLLKNYDVIYFQDEQIAKWKKKKPPLFRVVCSSLMNISLGIMNQ